MTKETPYTSKPASLREHQRLIARGKRIAADLAKTRARTLPEIPLAWDTPEQAPYNHDIPPPGSEPREQKVEFWADELLQKALDDYAYSHGCSRATAITLLVKRALTNIKIGQF
jgi:hypothetical protein